jgi:hypothetical protein
MSISLNNFNATFVFDMPSELCPEAAHDPARQEDGPIDDLTATVTSEVAEWWTDKTGAVMRMAHAIAEGDEGTGLAHGCQAIADNSPHVALAACAAVAIELSTVSDYLRGLEVACLEHAREWTLERVALWMTQKAPGEPVPFAADLYGPFDDVHRLLGAEGGSPVGRRGPTRGPFQGTIDPTDRTLYHPIRRGRVGWKTFRTNTYTETRASGFEEGEATERPALARGVTAVAVKHAFDVATHGLLRGVLGVGRESPEVSLVVAGGSLLNAATGKRHRDIDVFATLSRPDGARAIAGAATGQARVDLLERAAARRAVEGAGRLIEAAAKDGADGEESTMVSVIDTVQAVTVVVRHWAPGAPKAQMWTETVQFVKRLYVSPMQVALSFDIDLAKLVYDGQTVHCTRAALRSIKAQTFFVDPLKATYSGRFVKYVVNYGWHCVVPHYEGLDALLGWFARTHGSVHSSDALFALARSDTLAGILARHLQNTRRHTADLDLDGTYGCPQPSAHPGTPDASPKEKPFVPGTLERLMVGGWEVVDPCVRLYTSSGSDFLSIP